MRTSGTTPEISVTDGIHLNAICSVEANAIEPISNRSTTSETNTTALFKPPRSVRSRTAAGKQIPTLSI